MKLRIGTRRSKLALVQTNLVREKILCFFPEAEIEIVEIVTEGDRQKERSLGSFGGKGVFTQDIERALLAGEIDLAVHSAKDMPVKLAEGLTLGAVLGREDPSDVLVTRSGIQAAKLPAGSVIGTSSLRRELQIRQINPQVKIKVLRGNVPTRLNKLREGQYDGIILAAAGLKRLGLDQPENLYVEYLNQQNFLPAPGQGLLGVECRKGDLTEVMQAIHQPEAAMILSAERKYLTVLGGSCNAPCAAYCRRVGNELRMDGMYAADGQHPVYRSVSVKLGSEGAADACGEQQERIQSEEMVPCADDMITQAEKLAEKLAQMVQIRKVSLVGAGPGDAGLLTRKGLECIRHADVIIFDNLISGSLLNEAKLDAELIYVGKRAGHHHMTQDEIQDVLVEKALTGKYVVRLKGGDPFVFGRGSEEARVLKTYGIPYEIVPGVSSAYSVPAYAGIPVTDRNCASSFHVITGQEGGHKEKASLDYETLAKEEGTLIFLMGLRHVDTIAQKLIRYGKDAATPAAVIEKGTTAAQRKVCSDLGHITDEVVKQGIQTPAILVVGAVAALGDDLGWFGNEVLSGKRVLMTGTRHMAEELRKVLEPLGAELVTVSLIESRVLDNRDDTNGAEDIKCAGGMNDVEGANGTEGMNCAEDVRGTADKAAVKIGEALEAMERYSWLVFTSGNGVELFFEKLKKEKMDIRRLSHLKFAAIGRKTAQALGEYGIFCDFVPTAYSSETLAKEWIPTLKPNDQVLLMRAKEGASALPEGLREAGISFDDVALYETWVDHRRMEELNRILPEVDYVILASGSAAKAFAELISEDAKAALESCGDKAKLISIGPSTTQAAKQMGLKIYATASEYTADGVAAAIMADVMKSQQLPKL